MQRRSLVVTVLAALVAMVVLFAGVVAEAEQPATLPPLPQLSFNVSKAVLQLLVYPDGSVQPVYSLRAAVSLGGTNVSGALRLLSVGEYTGNASGSRASLNASLTGIRVEKPIALSLDAAGNYRFQGGSGHAVLTATVNYTEEGRRYSLRLDSLQLDLAGGKSVTISVSVVLSKNLLEKLMEEGGKEGVKLPTVDEINEKLRENGFSYIRVKEVEYADIAGGAKRLRAKIVIDIDAMLRAARANGLSEKDAEAIKRLLTAPYRVEGSMQLRLDMKTMPSEKRAHLSLAYTATSRGDLEEMQRLMRSSSGSINALVRALLQPVLAKNPQAAIAVAQAERQAGMGTMFLTAPGSRVRLELEARIEKGRAEISIDYTGERIYIPASSPSTVAEKTLTALALQYQRLASSIGQLALILPGVSQAVPLKVKLVPAEPCVKLSRTEATITQLPSIRADLSACRQGKAKTTTSTTESRVTTSAAPSATPPSPATTTHTSTTVTMTPAKPATTITATTTTERTTTSSPTPPVVSKPTPPATGAGGGLGQAGLIAAAAILTVVALAAGLALRRR